MKSNRQYQSLSKAFLFWLIVTGLLSAASGFANNNMHTTKSFSGAKVNGGTATHSKQGNMNILTLSDDFKVPDTPEPHWQVVDSKGNTYLLERLMIKGDKFN